MDLCYWNYRKQSGENANLRNWHDETTDATIIYLDEQSSKDYIGYYTLTNWLINLLCENRFEKMKKNGKESEDLLDSSSGDNKIELK